jgi:hypothetical protein
MRLGVVWESNSNAHYRAMDPMKAMERRGHDVVCAGQSPANGATTAAARTAVIDAFTTRERCRRKANRPPGEAALAEAARHGRPPLTTAFTT